METGILPNYNTSLLSGTPLTSPGYVSGEYLKGISYTLLNDTYTQFGGADSCITAMNVPENGGWVGLSTSEPKIYNQVFHHLVEDLVYNIVVLLILVQLDLLLYQIQHHLMQKQEIQ